MRSIVKSAASIGACVRQAAVMFGAGFYDLKSCWRVGLLMGVFNLVVWAAVGSVWWKLAGFI